GAARGAAGVPGGGGHGVAGREEPVERADRQLVGAAPAGARRRGRVRPDGGQPVPAQRPVPALAAGPRAAVVQLRAAGGAGDIRPGEGADTVSEYTSIGAGARANS